MLDDRYLLVDDGLKALQQLANHHRRQMDELAVLGITGSNGKTTTKELIQAALGTSDEVLVTEGNLNNHIGVPLTLLDLTHSHRIAVIEMGASKPGDIKELCDIAEPDLGLITNIGQAHLEGFGGFQGVLKTKTELYDHIRKAKGLNQKTYGIGCGQVNGTKSSSGQFLSFTWNGSAEITTKLFGDHNLTNGLAAICVGAHFGIDQDHMAEGIAAYTPSNNRSQWEQTEKNTLIMDAYNANPTSVKSALSSFAAVDSTLEKLVILGDMFELGAASAEAHSGVVQDILEKGLKAILVGTGFHHAAAGSLLAFKTTEEVLDHIKSNPVENRCILIKGSRGMKLERLYELL